MEDTSFPYDSKYNYHNATKHSGTLFDGALKGNMVLKYIGKEDYEVGVNNVKNVKNCGICIGKKASKILCASLLGIESLSIKYCKAIIIHSEQIFAFGP